MIKCRLTYQTEHPWYTENSISVKGSAFLNDTLLQTDRLLQYFQSVSDEASFKAHLQKISGHFSVVIERTDSYFIAADTIRTFPLFIRIKEDDLLISDTIDIATGKWNESEIANFKKVYCTLENNTLLQEWKQLQAGEYAVINKQNTTLSIQSYYRHKGEDNKEKKNDTILKLKEVEHKIIDKAITYAANRIILIPLSGGYDSRYLLALLKEKKYPKIECYTYGRKDSYEVNTAKEVCEQLSIKCHFIEYTDELLQSFFTKEWQHYATLNHHYSSLPHEQDFFALYYLKRNNLLPKDAVVMNGFCQDIHAGSFIEPIKNFDLEKFVLHKYQLKLTLPTYENSWNGYQEWLVKNRLSKFIVNSVQVYEYFGLDFYLPFWNTDWISFWYSLPLELRLHQQFYHNYLFNGIFKKHNINIRKPSYDSAAKSDRLKNIVKHILPDSFVHYFQRQNNKDISKDVNNTLFLYEEIYKRLKNKPTEKDFRINNIHTLYLLQTLKEKHQL